MYFLVNHVTSSLLLCGSISLLIALGTAVDATPVVSSRDDDVTPASVAEMLRHANVLRDGGNIRTSFELTYYLPRSPDSAEPWDQQPVILHEEIEHTFCGDMFAMRKRNLATDGDEAGYEQLGVWRDSVWDTRVRGEETFVTLGALAAPGDIFGQGLIFNGAEGRVPSFETLAELSLEGERLDASRSGDVLTYTFVRPEQPQVKFEVAMDLTSTPRLVRYVIEIRDTAGDVISRQTYTVSAWDDSLGIPERVVLDGWKRDSPNPSLPSPLATHAVYSRATYERLHDGCSELDIFETSFDLGTRVTDGVRGISYEIGKNMLSMDGVVYELREPLDGHPGDDLQGIIGSATSSTPISPIDSDSSPGKPSRGTTRTAMLAIAVVALGAGALLLLRAFKKRAATG